MNTFLRTLLFLALCVWLGAEIFLPIAAAVTFHRLAPDTHTAGTIVGSLLRILHGMGIVSGVVAMAALALSAATHIYHPRMVLAPVALIIVMIGCTLYSQFGITPAMERDRIAAGGAIDTSNPANPITAHFQKLHKRSEHVETAIILLGVATVVLVAAAEASKISPQ